MVSIFRSQNPLKYENVSLNKQQVLRKQRTPRRKLFILQKKTLHSPRKVDIMQLKINHATPTQQKYLFLQDVLEKMLSNSILHANIPNMSN